MLYWVSAAFAAISLLAGLESQANDSVGHLAAGGVVLGRSNDIEMRSEDLTISPDEVRISYRFFNKSAADVEALVAFPMPDMPAPSDVMSVSIPVEDDDNFLAFETRVNGAAVETIVDQRAIALGVDRTELLRSFGIPLLPQSAAAREAVTTLPQQQRNELLALGVLREEPSGADPARPTNAFVNWQLRTTYFWRQRFPAGVDVLIEHRYKPSVGASAGTLIGSEYAEPGAIDDDIRRYCLDQAFIETAAALHQELKRKGAGTLMEQHLEYVLSTGANWAGRIGDFRLIVDKGSPEALLSFCADDARPISPTQLEVRRKDFTPDKNLEILILRPAR